MTGQITLIKFDTNYLRLHLFNMCFGSLQRSVKKPLSETEINPEDALVVEAKGRNF